MKVGTLEIELLANMARLQSDMNQAKQTVGSAMSSVTKVVGIAQAAFVALGVAALAVNFLEGIKGAIDHADALNKLSQRTGVQVEQLSQLQYAAKMADVSNESLATGLKKLNISIAAGVAGGSEQLAMFKELGITLTDTAGRTKSADVVLMEIADSFATAKDGAGKTAMAVALLGKAGDEMIPLLNGGGQALRDLMKEADKLGLTISTDFAAKSEEFNDNLTRLQVSSQKLAIMLAGELVDGLGKAMKAMADAVIEGGRLHGIMVGLDTLFNGDAQHKNNVALVKDTDRMMALESGMQKLRAAGHDDTTLAMRSQKKQLDEVNARLKITQTERKGLADEADKSTKAAAAIAKIKKDGREIKVPPKGSGGGGGDSAAKKAAAEEAKVIAEMGGLTPGFYKSWEGLNGLFDKGRLSLEQLTKAQADLLAKQPFHRAELAKEHDLMQLEHAANLKAADLLRNLTNRREEDAKQMQKTAAAQEEYNARLGLGTDALRAIEAAKLEDSAADAKRQALLADMIDFSGKMGNAYSDEADALLRLAAVRRATNTAMENSILERGAGARTSFQDELTATAKLSSNPLFTLQDQDAQKAKMLRDNGVDPTAMAVGLEAQRSQLQTYQDQIRAMKEKGVIDEMTMNQALAQNRVQMNELQLQGTMSMLNSLAGLSQSSNKKLAGIGKAAAIAQATIDGILAVQKALASGPPPWNYITAAAVGVSAAANVGRIAGMKGFAAGGYTGDGGRGDIAGVTHGKEFVMNATATARNRPQLEAMNSGQAVSGSSGGERVIMAHFEINNNIEVQGSGSASSAESLTMAASTISRKTQSDIMESIRMGGVWSKVIKAN